MDIKWQLNKVNIKQLKPYQGNPRRLTEKGMEDLKRSIDKFGLAEPIIVNTDNVIIGGHARYYTLLNNNIDDVECYVPNRKLTKKEVKELNIRLNKNIAGEFDFDMLANQYELEDLLNWGFEESELDLSLWNDITDEQLDEVPKIHQEPISQMGDIFLIDEKHRIMCGDSTNINDVEKLMNGKKADMVFTDPPYNVDYKGNHKVTIKNDAMAKDKYEVFLKTVFQNYRMAIKDNAGLYVCHASKWQKLTEEMMNLADIVMRNQII